MLVSDLLERLIRSAIRKKIIKPSPQWLALLLQVAKTVPEEETCLVLDTLTAKGWAPSDLQTQSLLQCLPFLREGTVQSLAEDLDRQGMQDLLDHLVKGTTLALVLRQRGRLSGEEDPLEAKTSPLHFLQEAAWIPLLSLAQDLLDAPTECTGSTLPPAST